MHGFDVNDTLCLNCEIHDLWVRGTVPRAKSVWPYSENILNVKKSFSSSPIHVCEKLVAWL